MFLVRQSLEFIARDKLSVFLFHKVPQVRDALVPNDIDQARFCEMLAFIESHFDIYPLADAVRLLNSNRLPGRCAAITFDDGYADWRTGVAKVLLAKSIPATFFITSGQFFGKPMWHERLANVLKSFTGTSLAHPAVKLPALPTETLAQRVKALQTLEFHFKYLPPVARDIFLAQLEESVGTNAGKVPVMSSEDLVAIGNAGFEIGAHTDNHPILSLCDSERAIHEIAQTREILEGIVKRPVTSFAYPNGRPGIDFSYRHIEMVKAAGYDYAVTTQWGVGRPDSSPFQIPRFTPWGLSMGHMSWQLLRNLYSKQESLKETR